ncbi:MAG: tetratricopeptide repeat protein [Bacteroidales bacterium]|nr:tetratricopeptide repeat protein [Bacteroidales bacterium]
MKKRFLAFLTALFLYSVLFAQQGSTEQLAIEFLRSGQTEQAIQLFSEIYSRAPTQHIYRHYLDALLQRGNMREAERLVRRHMRNFPQNPTTAVDLGHVFFVSGDQSRANREFQAIIDRLPNNQNQITEIAIAFFNRGQTEFAIQTFTKGRQILNNPHAFSRDLATLYEQANRIADMTNEFLIMLENNPNTLSFVLQRIQMVLANDRDNRAAAEIRRTTLNYIQRNPQSHIAQDFWISFLLSIEDFETALTFARAYDRRFNDHGRRVFEVARIAQSSGSLVAEQAYQFLIAKGGASPLYFEARMGLLSFLYQQITTAVVVDTRALLALEQQYIELLSNRPLTAQIVPLIRDWARITAFYKNDFERADSLLNVAKRIPNLPRRILADLRLDLADIYLFIGEPWEATLLYSQVQNEFRHDEIGSEATFRNARLFYFIGEFEWSLAQLDVLRAATSKLIANDAMQMSLLIRENADFDGGFESLRLFASADLLIYQRKYDEALLIFDSIRRKQFSHPLFDDILMRRAQIALRRGNPEDALEYLERLYTFHAGELLADEALFLAARINEEQLNRPITAMALYEKLIADHPSSLLVPEARRRFRQLQAI